MKSDFRELTYVPLVTLYSFQLHFIFVHMVIIAAIKNSLHKYS